MDCQIQIQLWVLQNPRNVHHSITVKDNMKKAIFYTASIFIALILFSCKRTVENDFSGITGKWKIAVDSSYVGVGLANHAVVYYGNSADYFQFNSDGKLTIREGSTVRTVTYTLTSVATIDITSFIEGSDLDRHCQLQLTTGTAVISTGFSYTPGGIFGRKVYLFR